MGKVDECLAWLVPRRCVLCNQPSGARSLCAGCRDDLPWLGPLCAACGRPLPAGTAPGRCGPCADRPAPDGLVAALAYEFPVDRMVTRAKFSGALWLSAALGELLACAVAADLAGRAPPELVIPVPLHHRRLAHRGYNQALEIARPVASILGLRLVPRACRRVRATPSQTALAAEERRRNLRGAFVAGSEVAGARIAVVDDVMTTGSTAAAMVEALRSAGAARVEVWVAARVLEDATTRA